MNAEPFQDVAFPHDEPDEDAVVSRHPGQSAFYLVVSMLLAFFVVWGLEVAVMGIPRWRNAPRSRMATNVSLVTTNSPGARPPHRPRVQSPRWLSSKPLNS